MFRGSSLISRFTSSSRPVSAAALNHLLRGQRSFASLSNRNDFPVTLGMPTPVQQALGPMGKSVDLSMPVDTPWFPRCIKDIDQFSRSTLDAGTDLEADHPGFADKEYRARREAIAEIARNYMGGDIIPNIDYTAQESKTWKTVYEVLTFLYKKHACKEFNECFDALVDAGIYSADRIPQLQEISDFTKARSGFTFRPVTGLLSGRDFLNALAFKVFFSTQYIRHHSVPLFTPEPDVCHELMGHGPMFLNQDFADFCQIIGLASLGASDEELKKLATCFWFSVEFGLLEEAGELKAYGAGLLSSFGELQHACDATNANRVVFPWNPEVAAIQEYPITTFQPVYFCASSLNDAKHRLLAYCRNIERGFNLMLDPQTQQIITDRPVRFKKPTDASELPKSIC